MNASTCPTAKIVIVDHQQADTCVREQAALLDLASDAILVRDMSDRILYWNQGAERLYGWSASEAIGRKTGEVLNQGRQADLAEAVQTVVKEGRWQGELRQVARDGREVIVASRWTLVRDAEGRPKSQLVINTEITDKKGLEAQLVQAQRLEAIGQLAGGIAHDFNDLLTVITGFSELALDGLQPSEPAHELISEVHKAGERAAALTRQLLAFSRKQVLAAVVLDLNDLVGATEKRLGQLIGADIDLTITLDPALGTVKADPGQMEQVLMNLVINARDAMPKGGQLTIATRNLDKAPSALASGAGLRSGPSVLLSVSDTGAGMDDATRARIFEPFFTTKGAGKGTGLGLATVHGIVKQSGGSIEVSSKPGQGSTFRVYLPRVAQAAKLRQCA
jgi:PAS domain S-box-containing protein